MPASAGNQTRDLSHRSLKRYCSANETTESIDWSKAVYLF